MRKLLAAVLFLICSATLAQAEERITLFSVSAVIQPDAIVKVREQIHVVAEGNQIRHGIFRDFPTDYENAQGQRVRVDFNVEDVKLDGRDVPYKLESINGGMRVKIGDANSYVPNGQHSYTISYTASREIGFFDSYDEFYWNVTGNGWGFPIEKASITVQLPDGASIVQHSEYTGFAGQTGSAARVTSASGNRYAAETAGQLAPGEGFTIAVAWPKGFVAAPSGTQQGLWLIRDNAWFFISAVTLLGALGFYVSAWDRVGRDPPAAQVVPLFYPPKGFGPGEVRYLWQQGFDNKTFASAIVGLAVKGGVRISDVGSERVLQKAGEMPSGLSAGEVALFNAMPNGRIVLEQSQHSRVSTMRTSLAKALRGQFDGSHFKRNLGWIAAGGLLSIAGLALAAALTPGKEGVMVLFLSVWLGIWWGATLTGLISSVRKLAGGGGVMAKFGSMFTLLFLVPFVAAGIIVPAGFLFFGQLSREVIIFALIVIVLLAVNMLFYRLMSAPTAIGQKLLGEIEGFRLYLATAEEQRLNMLNPPEKTPELFERYLPYAIALDCENEWGDKFAAVLAAAAAAGAAASPSWYTGNNWSSANPGSFGRDMGSSFASTLASAGRAPGSSSGSGGGGSSGGGGGGGGGGGW